MRAATEIVAVNGVLVVDKPAGPTSHDVVNEARRALGTRRVGHTGTLDPLASGVLPLVVGQATRLSQFLTGAVKGYLAAIRLGVCTDTYDRAGEVTARTPEAAVRAITAEQVERALDPFRGRFEQMPPPYSAKKVGGVRAYALARARQAVQPGPVAVTVHELVLVSLDDGLVRVRVEASAGFYVRSLAHDIGQKLGCGAHLESLQRYRSGEYTLEQAIPLALLREDPGAAAARIVPMDRMLAEFPGFRLSEAGARRAAHGNAVRAGEAVPAGGPWPGRDALVRLFEPGGRLLAVARVVEGGALQPVVVLG